MTIVGCHLWEVMRKKKSHRISRNIIQVLNIKNNDILLVERQECLLMVVQFCFFILLNGTTPFSSKILVCVTEHEELAETMHYPTYYHLISPFLGTTPVCFLKDEQEHKINFRTRFTMTMHFARERAESKIHSVTLTCFLFPVRQKSVEMHLGLNLLL